MPRVAARALDFGLLVLLISCAPACAQQPATTLAIVTVPGAPNCPIFPADNVWNEDISALPVAADSAAIINAIGAGTGLHPDFGSFAGYGIPYNVVSKTTAKVSVNFLYASESDAGPYPIPANYLIEGNDIAACNNGTGGDCHVLIVDKDACRLYELYDLQQAGGSFNAGSGAIWYLWSNALRPDTWTSADAAGLPILPGLVRYDEVASGAMNHALRFTAQHTRNAHIYPARHDAGSASYLPPMGMRVRLKASVDISGFTPQAQVVLAALKKYGMLLADNGSNWYISGASDPNFDDADLHNLNQIKGSDLEVVDTSSLFNGPDPDFTLSLTNPVAGPVFPGVAANFAGNLGAIGGYSAPVTISCGSGAPTACTPNPASAFPSAPFSVTASGSSPQDYTFPVSGVGGDPDALTHSTTATLHVVDYRISAPAQITVTQGNPSAPVAIGIIGLNGFAGDVGLSCAGLPSGSSCQFLPGTLSSGMSGALIVVPGSAPVGGPTTVTISGSSAGQPSARTASFGLTISATAGSADMKATVTHSLAPGNSTGIAPVGSTVIFHAVLADTSSTQTVSGNLLIAFSAPVTAGKLPKGCGAAADGSISCAATLSSGSSTQFDIPVSVGFLRALTATAFASSNLAESFPADNVQFDTVQVRPRPLTVP